MNSQCSISNTDCSVIFTWNNILLGKSLTYSRDNYISSGITASIVASTLMPDSLNGSSASAGTSKETEFVDGAAAGEGESLVLSLRKSVTHRCF
jgi:hypothetical protein